MWKKPNVGWHKCNSIGASKRNPEPSAIAYCVRDEEGGIKFNTCREINETTNIIVEAISIKQGCEFYVANQFLHLVLETNSLALTKCLKVIGKFPAIQLQLLRD